MVQPPTSDTAALVEGMQCRPGGMIADLGSGPYSAMRMAPGCAPDCSWICLDLDCEALSVRPRPGNAIPVACDVARVPFALARGVADIVLANPPFMCGSSCRRSPDPGRDRARASAGFTSAFFLRAAAHLLSERGELRIVQRPAALGALLAGCAAYGLSPFEIQPFGSPGAPSVTVRVRARPGSAADLVLLPQKPFPGCPPRDGDD